MKKLEWMLMVFVLLVLSAHAGTITITYSASGTFSADTPPTTFSNGSAPWSVSFQADSNPAVSDVGNGGFDIAFSNFSYSLNGSSSDITPTAIRFFSPANGGGLFICFLQPCGNGVFPDGLGTGFFSEPLYTGPNSTPTLETGLFLLSPFGVAVDPNTYPQADTILQAVATLNSFPGGTTSAPAFLIASLVGGVTGTISGQGSQDYYAFLWDGGPFSATASITGANTGASYLFSEGAIGTCSSAPQTLNSGNNFIDTISIPNLPAGEYCIGLNADNPNDPSFSLVFDTPVTGVPEPSAFVLFSIGLGTLSVFRPKKHYEK